MAGELQLHALCLHTTWASAPPTPGPRPPCPKVPPAPVAPPVAPAVAPPVAPPVVPPSPSTLPGSTHGSVQPAPNTIQVTNTAVRRMEPRGALPQARGTGRRPAGAARLRGSGRSGTIEDTFAGSRRMFRSIDSCRFHRPLRLLSGMSISAATSLQNRSMGFVNSADRFPRVGVRNSAFFNPDMRQFMGKSEYLCCSRITAIYKY